ncbi:MAG: DNA double-strand break repair nuclease NurA [Pyrinomonadaceae bacterium]|nr:DNA double-strand break repair nuclease NurA [Pyrinomonadaceae bacterium]
MLYRHHLASALDARRADFVRFERDWQAEARCYVEHLRALGSRSHEDVRRAALAIMKSPGALPSAELDERKAVAVPFENIWRSHEEARSWAIEVLQNRVTCAADGSQILPGRDISLPVAAVQAVVFENPHTRAGSYRKEAHFEVVAPEELLEGEGGQARAEAAVNFRRFQLETELLGEFLKKHAGWRARGERVPVAFLDGTLLISYARPRTNIQDKYVSAIIDLVKLSRATEVPLIGYIDRSYARDIVNMLETIASNRCRAALNDAQLLHHSFDGAPPALHGWGDRTIFCYALREGLGAEFMDEEGEPLVGFIYLQTTGDAAPARLDVPSWIYEAGLLDEVMDVVRAECVVGNGYPYAVETADAAAVITAADRWEFLRAVQEFAKKQDFAFHISRKAMSKSRRR